MYKHRTLSAKVEYSSFAIKYLHVRPTFASWVVAATFFLLKPSRNLLAYVYFSKSIEE